MSGAGFRTGTATHRTRHVPVRRILGQMKSTNAGIIERTPDNNSIKIMCMPDNKNSTKCRMPVWKLAQPRTSTATHRTRRVPDWRMPGPRNLINAGIQVIERTPSDKSIKIMCMRVDKNKINVK
jgi:hypothetical protein